MEISGRTAVVTGAGRGIGLSIARRLARDGAGVLVVDRDRGHGDAAVERIRAEGGQASLLVADLAVAAGVERMIASAVDDRGGIDILVNNAGGYAQPVFGDAPAEHWLRTLDLNLRSVMLAIHAALPTLEARGGGAVVNLSSSAGLGLGAHPGIEYATAKAAVIRLTACLAPLAERGVRVNCICPHTVATEVVLETIAALRAAGSPLPPALEDELIDPDELAGLAAELVRDESLAGRVVVVRGGEPPRLLPIDAAW
jgi:NAD(P)-dependent dehydrogenase (short-subunit alcohol dehydrogenase family)